MVWAVCRHLLSDPGDAEDTFQATFLALVQSAGTIRDGAAVGGWLHGVATRLATKVKRSAVRRRQREHRTAAGENDRSVPESSWAALLAAVHEEVQQLPEPLRTAFVLCDLEGVRQPDAASRLGLKPGTLTGRLSRARQLLLDRLTKRGLVPALAGGAVGLGITTGAGAVPASLIDKAVTIAKAGGVAPPAILKLVREATPMVLTQTKLIAAAVLVASGLAVGLGTKLLPVVHGQPPANNLPEQATRPATASNTVVGSSRSADAAPADGLLMPTGTPPGVGSAMSGAPPGMPSYGGMATAGAGNRPVWEYDFVAVVEQQAFFEQAIRRHGQDGWEFCGSERVRKDGALQLVLVFKRPQHIATNVPPGGMPASRSGGSGGRESVPAGGMPLPRANDRSEKPIDSPQTATKAADSFPMGTEARDPLRRSASGSGSGMFRNMAGSSSGGIAKPTGQPITLIPLKHCSATDIEPALNKVFATRGAVAIAEPRTNSIIFQGSPEAQEVLRSLLEKLDVPLSPQR